MPEFVGSPKRRGVAWKCLVSKGTSVNKWENWGKESPEQPPPPEPLLKKKRKDPPKPYNVRPFGRKRRRRSKEWRKNNIDSSIKNHDDYTLKLEVKTEHNLMQSRIDVSKEAKATVNNSAISPQDRQRNDNSIFPFVSATKRSSENEDDVLEDNYTTRETATNNHSIRSLKDPFTNDSAKIRLSIISPQEREARKSGTQEEELRLPVTVSKLQQADKTTNFISPPACKKVDNRNTIEVNVQSTPNVTVETTRQMDNSKCERGIQHNLEKTDKMNKIELLPLHGTETSKNSIPRMKQNNSGVWDNQLSYMDTSNEKVHQDGIAAVKQDCHRQLHIPQGTLEKQHSVKKYYCFADGLQQTSGKRKEEIHKTKIVAYKKSQVNTNNYSISSSSQLPKNVVALVGRNSNVISGLNDSDSEEDSVDNVTITTDAAIVPPTPKTSLTTHQPVVRYWQSKRSNRMRSSRSLWMTQVLNKEVPKYNASAKRKSSPRRTLRKRHGVPQLESALEKHRFLDRDLFQETHKNCVIVQENIVTPSNDSYVSVLERINSIDANNIRMGQISSDHQWKCCSPRILELCYDINSISKPCNLLLKQIQWEAALHFHLHKSEEGRNSFPKPLKAVTSKTQVSLQMELASNLRIVGTLLDVVQIQYRFERGPIPESIVCWLVSQIADILFFIHRNGISHNSLSLESFLLGYCEDSKKWMLVMTGLGSNGVVCSQLLPKKDRPHVFSHDAFSLAAIIWSLLTNGVPFLFELNETVSIDCLRAVEYNMGLRGRTLWTGLLNLLVNEYSLKEDLAGLLEAPLKSLHELIISKERKDQEKFIDSFFKNFQQLRGTRCFQNDQVHFDGFDMTVEQLKEKLNLGDRTTTTSRCNSIEFQEATLEKLGKSIENKDMTRTRKIYQQKKMPIQRRHSRRRVLCCGMPQCGMPWPENGHMWFLVYSWTKVRGCEKDMPLIPVNHPMHLVCTKCLERKGASTYEPSGILKGKDKAALKQWEKYEYFWGTKGEYEAKLNKIVEKV